MKYYIFTALLGLVGAYKSPAKDKLLAGAYKAMPAITNSLVNLGKMDVSFYINAKDHDKIQRKISEQSSPFSSLFMQKGAVSDEPCPCSMMKNLKDAFSNSPHNLLNKILMSNDLFSVKNPMLSPLCCESHEDGAGVESANLFFEFGSKSAHSPLETEIAFPAPSFDSFLPRVADLSSKPKTIEIVFLPKKPFEKSHSKKVQSKKDIAVVGKDSISNRYEKTASPFTPSVAFKTSIIESLEKKEEKEKPLSPEDLNKAEQVPVKDSNSLIK